MARKTNTKDRGFFKRKDGLVIYYEDIDSAINALHPEFCGSHIFAQLKVLGLLEVFMEGKAPCTLPYSFTGSAE